MKNLEMDYNNITWRCSVCKKIRKDKDISVFIMRATLDSDATADVHTLYCNDNEDCRKKAETSYLKFKKVFDTLDAARWEKLQVN